MAYSVLPTPVTGDIISAAYWSTYLKDNFAAVFPYTTAGDISYATSSSALTRLAAGSAYSLLVSSGTVPQYSTLSTVTANSAIVGSQAAGDIPYASSASALARLALGTSRKFLRAGSSAPEYAPIIEKRQGGNATNWITAGSTNYTPSAPFIQTGVVSVSVNTTGSASVNLPTAYTDNPIIVVTPYADGGSIIASVGAVSSSAFDVYLHDVTTSGTLTIRVLWIAIGE